MENIEDCDVIYSYTRKQAIEDGVLVDVSETAREAGFKFAVAISAAVWQYIVPPPEIEDIQDLQGRLWDLLTMLRFKAKTSSGSTIYFEVLFQMKPNKRELIKFKAVCGPGDEGEPVITVMLPEED